MFQGGFEKVLNFVEERSTKEWVGIPQKYSKMEEFIPYYEKGTYLLVSAHSGVGKTIFTISDWIVEPYLFYKETGYKVKIFYFSLEKKETIVDAQVLSNLYYQYSKEKVSKQALYSNKLSDNSLHNLGELSKLYHDYKDIVTVIDNVYSANDIKKYMQSYFLKNGKMEGKKYIPNDDTHYIIITDTLNALSPEQGKAKNQSLNEYSREVCKNLFCDLYGATVVNVQQQDKDAEKSAFTFKGEINYQATRPSRNSLGESKLTFNDADFFITLYSPYMYRVPQYPFPGEKEFWDIKQLKNKFLLMSLEKNRDGESPTEIGLYADLSVNYFEELPHFTDFMKDKTLYTYYNNK